MAIATNLPSIDVQTSDPLLVGTYSTEIEVSVVSGDCGFSTLPPTVQKVPVTIDVTCHLTSIVPPLTGVNSIDYIVADLAFVEPDPLFTIEPSICEA